MLNALFLSNLAIIRNATAIKGQEKRGFLDTALGKCDPKRS